MSKLSSIGMAALLPALFALKALYDVGSPMPQHAPGEVYTGSLPVTVILVFGAVAVAAYLAGQSAKD